VKLFSVILNVSDTFERIIRFYAEQFDHKPLLVDLTAGKRRMYESLIKIPEICEFIFIDIDESYKPSLVCDSRLVSLRDSIADIVVVDLPYPTKLMSWHRHLYKTWSIRRYRYIAKQIGKEAWRILRKDGVLIWKCIDVFFKNKPRYEYVHAYVAERMKRIGFTPWDIVIAIEPKAATRTYRRSVGLHTYFLIFRKFG